MTQSEQAFQRLSKSSDIIEAWNTLSTTRRMERILQIFPDEY